MTNEDVDQFKGKTWLRREPRPPIVPETVETNHSPITLSRPGAGPYAPLKAAIEWSFAIMSFVIYRVSSRGPGAMVGPPVGSM